MGALYTFICVKLLYGNMEGFRRVDQSQLYADLKSRSACVKSPGLTT